MNLLDLILEPLSYDFMLRALLVALVASIVCAVLSCWLVLIGWSLMGDAVSHAVLPGVVLAYVVGAPFALGAVIFGFAAVALIGVVRDTSRMIAGMCSYRASESFGTSTPHSSSVVPRKMEYRSVTSQSARVAFV